MEVHNEQRKNVSDRRVADTAEFPLQDRDGTWVITDRREKRGRGRRSGLDDSMLAQAGWISPVLSAGVLMLAGFLILVRAGMIDAPSWLPIWAPYPEILITQLF
jgi:hypothetical protein